MIFKKFLAITLIICLATSVFLLPVYSAELSIPTVAFQLSADKISASAADAVLNDNYIALVIAIIGLVASVISVVLLVADRRKEAAESRKKEYAESRQKNNEKGDIS